MRRQELSTAYVAFGIASCALIAARSALARGFDYNDFASTSGLVLGPDATTAASIDGQVLRLATGSEQNFGSVTHSTPQSLAAFSTEISFRTTGRGGAVDPAGGQGGDGYYFSFGASTDFNPRGPDIVPILGTLVGTPLVIQLDTFWNPEVGETAGSNAITVYGLTGGLSVLANIPITPDFDNGDRWWAWLDYASNTFELRVAPNPIRPAAAALTLPFDLTQALGTDTGHVGLSAFSGGAFGQHDLISWSMVPSAPTAVLGLALLAPMSQRRR